MPSDDEQMTIHPAAEAFPLLPDDELQELADSIKEHGLDKPIMLSSDGRQLVDGRNRLRACELAGVEPRYDWLAPGADPRAHIVSANITRRHISKGQQALALALIYPEVEKGGRGKKRENGLETKQFSKTLLSHARSIARHPDLTELVKAGTMKFDMALEEAQRRDRVEDHSAFYMEQLRTHAPDLAGQVAEEHLTLMEAWGAYEARKREAERQEQAKRETCLIALAGFFASTSSINIALLEETLKAPGFEAQLNKHLHLDTIDRGAARRAMADGTTALTDVMQRLLS